MWPWRSAGRKADHSLIPETSSHARQARTGQVTGFDPKGMPSVRPAPSWPVFQQADADRRAGTGQVTGFDPKGMPSVRPAPSWSVFEEPDGEAVGSLGDVGHIESDQFAPAQCAREPQQKEHPVPFATSSTWGDARVAPNSGRGD